MRANKLKSLPEFLWELSELEEVILDGHLFSCLPKDIKINGFTLESIKIILLARKNAIPYS